MLLTVARISSLTPIHVVAKDLVRPGAARISFGKIEEGEEEEEQEGEEKSYAWSDVVEMKWRIVRSLQ